MPSSVTLTISFAALILLAGAIEALSQDTRVFLYGRFLCSDGMPLPTLTRAQEPYLHEVRDGGTTRQQVCANVQGFSILSQLPIERRVAPPIKRKCETFDLVSYTVMCRGGAVSAARFFAAADSDRRLRDSSGPFEINGNSLLAPIYGSYSRPPDAYVALPAGFGFQPDLNASRQQVTLPWEKIASGTALSISAAIPSAPPVAEPAAVWVRIFRSWWPWPQLSIGLPLFAFAVIAMFGPRDTDRPYIHRRSVALYFLFAVGGLLFSHTPASMPGWAAMRAMNAITTAQSQLALAERDQVKLASLIRISSSTGMIEPVSQSDLKLAQSLIGTRSISASLNTKTYPSFWATVLLSPVLLCIGVGLPAFVRGYHYLFVPHPAGSIVAPPLRAGTLFPAAALGQALRPNPADLFDHPPAYKSRNLFEKARAIKEKITADADIADAAMRRDRARAQQMQAQAELREARKRLPWWQRWLVR